MTSLSNRDLTEDHGVVYDQYTEVVNPIGEQQTAVYVYEAPVRLWHWVNALCMIVLIVSGYLIASPPPSIGGEASNSFLFGYIRFAHFAAGQIMVVGFLARILWAFVGNHHATQLFVLPVWSSRWWKEVFFELKWYFFLERRPKKYIGHNPLAQLAMFFMFVLPMLVMIATGLALYGEGLGASHWLYGVTGFVNGMTGGSMQTHTIHHLGMWVLIVFAMTHIYVAFREDIMSRQSLISTMVSGWRMFKDDKTS
jgi:Ni/Fe-hydrogenase 1 B-type cytochrome subunit